MEDFTLQLESLMLTKTFGIMTESKQDEIVYKREI